MTENPGLIDSHCHIHLNQFDADRADIIGRAQAAGVQQFMAIGTNRDSCQQALALAEQFSFIYCSLGIHPHDAPQAGFDDLNWIEAQARRARVKAIGECGLDYHYPNADRVKQTEVFTAQIRLAQKLRLPLVIHNRQSTPDLLELLKQEKPAQGYCGHWHCFDESWETAQLALNMGLHLGFTGIITYRKNEALREVCKKVPADRLLLETDSPYLPPVPYRGQRNEPARLPIIAACLAEIKGITLKELCDSCYQNTCRLYGLAPSAPFT